VSAQMQVFMRTKAFALIPELSSRVVYEAFQAVQVGKIRVVSVAALARCWSANQI
jgi:hypothetical protein